MQPRGIDALLEARVLLRQLGLSGKRYTGDMLLTRLETHLGISIAAVPNPRLPGGGISGARITTNGSHVVFYPAGASERLQLAVICHECAHLLLNHRGRSMDDLLTGTDPPSPDDELAAEALGASLVHFSERPERLRSLLEGRKRPESSIGSSPISARLGSYH